MRGGGGTGTNLPSGGGGNASGGLVGDNGGTIDQSYANVSVTGATAGGLVGQNSDIIKQSYAVGRVNGSGINQIAGVGGLVGHNLGTVTQSYARGSVTGASFNLVGGLVGANDGANDNGQVTQSYATGPVSGGNGSSLGGLIGSRFGSATTSNSYWDNQTSGQLTSAGGTGEKTMDLQTGSLPTGFDPTVWVATHGRYPRLQWQVPTRPPVPVVFVHGLCSDEHSWDPLKRILVNFGWRFGGSVGQIGNSNAAAFDATFKHNADFYTINFADPAINNRGGLDGWATALHHYLRKIRINRGSLTGTKFIIVAHSAGGLAARAYLQGHANLHYDGDIFHLVTYGTPHNGTPLAGDSFGLAFIEAFLSGPCRNVTDLAGLLSGSSGVKEMLPGSKFLSEINGAKFPAGVLQTSLKAVADDLPVSGLSWCAPGWDCVVPVGSQNMESAYVGTPPLDLTLIATHTVTDRTHSTFDVPGLGVMPGETEDATSILWAIRRSIPGS
jgi:triacylglycerol esterase/lipase EstA (alpha/beta hydrolase family)